MPELYNLTNVTDANNMYETLVGINQLSNGLFALFILASLFFVLFMVFKKYEQDTKAVLLTTSTIVVVVSVLFWTIELITWRIMIYPVILLIASIIIYKFTG